MGAAGRFGPHGLPNGAAAAGWTAAPAVARRAPWDVLLAGVAGMLLVTTWRLQDLWPLLAKLQLPTLVTAVTYLTYLLTQDSRQRLVTVRHPVTYLAVAILVLMMLSVPGGLYPGLSFSFIFKDHIRTFLMMLLIAAVIRGLADIERLVRVQVFGAILYCLFVLTQVQIGQSGRLGDLFYYDANDLAMLLAAMLPLIIYFVRRQAPLRTRLLAALGLAVTLVTLVRTGSRGGFLALLGSGLYLAFGFSALPRRVRLSAVAAVVVLMGAVGSDRYWGMMETLLHPTQDYNFNDEAGRKEVWKRGIGYMMANPILGVGANAFPVAEGMLSPLAERQRLGKALKWSAAHNSFVQIGAELGVGGLLCFVALLVQAFRALRRAGRWARQASGPQAPELALSQALTATLIAYCIGGFFLSQAFSAFLYSILGMVVGLTKITPRPVRSALRPT